MAKITLETHLEGYGFEQYASVHSNQAGLGKALAESVQVIMDKKQGVPQEIRIIQQDVSCWSVNRGKAPSDQQYFYLIYVKPKAER